MLPATQRDPQRPGRPGPGLGAPASPSRWGRGGGPAPTLHQCVGVWPRSGKPHPRTPNPAPTTPPFGRRLPEGPGAWLMPHPSRLRRRGSRCPQGSGPSCPPTSSAACIRHLIPDLGVRTGSQKPWALPLTSCLAAERSCCEGWAWGLGCVGLGQATAPCLPAASSPFSPQRHLQQSSWAFFFFKCCFKTVVTAIAADGPAGCGRGWQLPRRAALRGSRGTKISSRVPLEDGKQAAGRARLAEHAARPPALPFHSPCCPARTNVSNF